MQCSMKSPLEVAAVAGSLGALDDDGVRNGFFAYAIRRIVPDFS